MCVGVWCVWACGVNVCVCVWACGMNVCVCGDMTERDRL